MLIGNQSLPELERNGYAHKFYQHIKTLKRSYVYIPVSRAENGESKVTDFLRGSDWG